MELDSIFEDADGISMIVTNIGSMTKDDHPWSASIVNTHGKIGFGWGKTASEAAEIAIKDLEGE